MSLMESGSPAEPPMAPHRRTALDLKPLTTAALLALVLLVGGVLVAGRDVLIPLALSVLIWQLINAIAARYRKLSFGGEAVAGWVRIGVGVGTIVVAAILVTNLIVANVGSVSASAPLFQANLLALIPRVADILGLPAPTSLSQLIGQIELDAWIRGLAATLASLAGNLGLIAIYVAFMLVEQRTFDAKIDALFPDPEKAARVRKILGHIERRIERYLWIKTLMSLATGFLSWVVLVAVGCQNAAFWGLVVFMLNYIPIIGSFLGVLLPALLTLVQFGTFGPFLFVVVSLGLIQFGFGNVLEPKLMGNSLNLSPVVLVVALAVWGSLWGVAGMFLCVPIMVIIMIVCAHFHATRPIAILLSATGRLDKDIPEPKRPAHA